jgi:protein-tyrosine-phosphatase
MVTSADLILTMTDAHKRRIQAIYNERANNLFTLKEFAQSNRSVPGGERDVQDPFGGDMSVYRETATELELYIRRTIDRIKKDGQA